MIYCVLIQCIWNEKRWSCMGNIISKATAAILAEYQCYYQILIPYSTIVWFWYQRTKVRAQGEVWYQPVFPSAGKGTSTRCVGAAVCFLQSWKFFPFVSSFWFVSTRYQPNELRLMWCFFFSEPCLNNKSNASVLLRHMLLVIIYAITGDVNLINKTQEMQMRNLGLNFIYFYVPLLSCRQF